MSDHSILAKPFILQKKDLSKIIEGIREKTNNIVNDEKKKNNNDDIEKKDAGKSVNYNYNFADEGDRKRKNFNFVAVGDFGCSKNAEKTVSNMESKKPELVLPLGDLSYDKTANCWLNFVSPFCDKLKVTLGFHDVNDGGSKLKQYEEALDCMNCMVPLIIDTCILLPWLQSLNSIKVLRNTSS